jgi:hypothetical protein
MAAVQRRSSAWGRAGVVAAEFARQLAIVLFGAFVYFRVRGLTEGRFATAADHGLDVLAFEHRHGLDIERQLQGVILDHDWLVTLANWVYMFGHWPVIIPTLVWLYFARRSRFLLLRNAMFISGSIGLLIFATYAVAPPRLLDLGIADTVTQRSNSYRVLQPPDLVNQYAALPSLHLGWNLLVGITLFGATRFWLVRVFAVLSPIAMAFAIVLTGNHYLVDGILGCLVALTGLAASAALTPRLVALDRRLRERLHQRRVVEDQPVHAPLDQAPSGALVQDSPGDDQAVRPLQLLDQRLREQPLVQDHTVDGRPGAQPAHEQQLEPVARRPEPPSRKLA